MKRAAKQSGEPGLAPRRAGRNVRGAWWAARAVILALAGAAAASAQTESGNELALRISRAEPARQTQVRKEAAGKLFFFRYLSITRLQRVETNGTVCFNIRAVEPSSEMVVSFAVDKAESLRKIESVQVGDAVAVTGRVKSFDKPKKEIELDPVVVRYKDRPSPKLRKELLYELDPEARRGTDTSGGKEEVLK